MKICSICHKISGTNEDHLDCKEKRRIELEAQDVKEKLPEKLDMAKNSDVLSSEIKAVLDHLVKEKENDP
ncbi:MAG TPA: hypothetical protein VH562_01000 [Nitrosopumilaceae archaeon]